MNDIAAFRLRFHYIRGAHPRMSATDALLAASGHDDGGGDHPLANETFHLLSTLHFPLALWGTIPSPMSNAAVSPMQRSLAETDPDIADAIRRETRRQAEGLELIASENFVSAAVLEAAGSVMTNKYAEGLSGKEGTTAAASSLTSRSRSRFRGRRRSSAPNTSTCNPTRARRRTWPSTSRCSSRAKPCSA